MIQYNKKIILQLILEELESMCNTENTEVKEKIKNIVIKLINALYII